MIDMELLSYQIKELNMVNDLKSSGSIKLVNSVASKCNWNKGVAEITLTERLQHYRYPNKFYIYLTLEGYFLVNDVKNIADKKELHSIGHQELLVYANKILLMLAKNSGMEGLNIRMLPLKADDIHFGSQSDAAKQEKIIRLRPENE